MTITAENKLFPFLTRFLLVVLPELIRPSWLDAKSFASLSSRNLMKSALVMILALEITFVRFGCSFSAYRSRSDWV